MFSMEYATIRLLVSLVGEHFQQARDRDRDLGASTIEWVIITGALVLIATIVIVAVTQLVTRHATQLNGL